MANHLWKEMIFTISNKKNSFCGFYLLKKEYISNFNEISLKKEQNYFWTLIFSFVWCATYLPNSLYGPHGTYISGSTFMLHQKGPRNSQSIFPLLSQGWNTLPGACSDLDINKCMANQCFKLLKLLVKILNIGRFELNKISPKLPADHFGCNSTNRQNLSIQQNCHHFWLIFVHLCWSWLVLVDLNWSWLILVDLFCLYFFFKCCCLSWFSWIILVVLFDLCWSLITLVFLVNICWSWFLHCTVRKTIEEMALRIRQPFRGLFNFSLSFTFILNS